MSEEIKVSEMPNVMDLNKEDSMMIIQNKINKRCEMKQLIGLMQSAFKENHIIVSSTIPTNENEKIWFKKGKNFLNLTYCKITNTNAISQWQKNNITVTSKGGWGNALIDGYVVENGKSYIFSVDYTNSEASNTGIIIYNENDETLNFQSATTQSGRFEVAFTANTNKIKIKFSANNTSENKNNVVTYTNVQMESGTTATSFEEYIEKEIYCKGNNGEWDKFTEEKDTGWIDMSAYVNTENFAARIGLPPMARKIGKVVYWMGYVYCIKDVNTWQADIMINLPEWAGSNNEVARTFSTWSVWNYGTMYVGGSVIRIGQNSNIQNVGENNWQGYSLAVISGYPSKGE